MKRFIFGVLAASVFFSFNDAMAYELTPRLSLSLAEEYNDNIRLTRENRESDFITRISPGLDLSLRLPKGEAGLGYAATFNRYSKNEGEDSTSHRFSGRGSFVLSERLTLSVSDVFVKSRETIDTIGVVGYHWSPWFTVIGPQGVPVGSVRFEEPTLGLIREKRELTVNMINSTLSYQINPQMAATLGLGYTSSDYEQDDASDLRSPSAALSLSYRIGERTTASANAKYTVFDYKGRSDADSQDYTLGLSYKVSPTLDANASGGISLTEIDDTGRRSTGFTGGVSLTKRYERGAATVGFRQAVISGVSDGEPLRSQAYTFRVTRELAERWKGGVFLSFTKYKSLETASRKTDELRAGGDLSYRILPWADAALSYSYARLDDKINDSGDYYNHIVLFTVRVSYERKMQF